MTVGPMRCLAVAGLLAIAATACASASPITTETPAPTPPGGITVSERFGYSMELPPGWVYRAATEDWPVHTYAAPGAPYTDNWERLGPGGFPVIDVSTQVLPADQSHEQFLADLDAGNAQLGCTVEATDEITVDGVPGRLQRQACAGGSEVAWEVTVFDGDRVYLVYWINLTEEAAADEPVFRQVLSTLRFASSAGS